MPRYFFHVINDHQTFPDEEGVLLADRHAAQEWALRDANDVIYQAAADVESWSNWRIEVRDEAGEVIAVVLFLDAVK